MDDLKWIKGIHINEPAVRTYASRYEKEVEKNKMIETLLLLKVITLLDLTTLGGDDTVSNLTSLVNKALFPIPDEIRRTLCYCATKCLDSLKKMSYSAYTPKSELKKVDVSKYILHLNVNPVRAVHGIRASSSQINLLNPTNLVYGLKLSSEQQSIGEFLANFLSLKNFLVETPDVTVAAICVYPQSIRKVAAILEERNRRRATAASSGSSLSTTAFSCERLDSLVIKELPIAAVSAGFPSGQYPITSKIAEVEYAVASGASEIDIVIDRSLVLGHRWRDLYNELCCLRNACGSVKMKTILSTGECGSLENIYKASTIAMMAGSDFIKTSTGKEAVNAVFPVGVVMCRAILDYYRNTGKRVGFKPAGGIKTADDALQWLKFVICELGTDWLPLFRIGASGVLSDIVKRLKQNIAKFS